MKTPSAGNFSGSKLRSQPVLNRTYWPDCRRLFHPVLGSHQKQKRAMRAARIDPIIDNACVASLEKRSATATATGRNVCFPPCPQKDPHNQATLLKLEAVQTLSLSLPNFTRQNSRQRFNQDDRLKAKQQCIS